MKHFAMIGAAGYIAPRHMKAIKDVGGNLIAAFDPNDSVGILDSYFPDADFFIEFERFDRHIDKMRRRGTAIGYVAICSPNYLHDAHIRFALRNHADAICEKPLVLNPWNIDALADIEKEGRGRIFNILQLRLHPVIQNLRKTVADAPPDRNFDVDLTYITGRGHWYHTSWKGDISKSGGVATNIGIHFFDMLQWVFGARRDMEVHYHGAAAAAGYISYERARVRWFLSIDVTHLPQVAREAGKRTYRSILVNGNELEFSEGFTDLHTVSYQAILDGQGFGLQDARPSIETAYEIRQAAPCGLSGEVHPLAVKLRKS